MSTCTVEGCDRAGRGRYCPAHWERLRLHGDVQADRPIGVYGDSAKYDAVHARLRRSRGRADAHSCGESGCPEQATRWSWQKRGPSRDGVDRRGKSITWGLDLATYEPRCNVHARADDQKEKQ